MKRRRTVRLPAELWDAASQVAASENKSMNDVINAFLARYVEDGLPNPDPEPQHQATTSTRYLKTLKYRVLAPQCKPL